jgi:hypothetical protein
MTPGIGYGIVDADGFASRSRTAISTNMLAPQALVIAALTGVYVTRLNPR